MDGVSCPGGGCCGRAGQPVPAAKGEGEDFRLVGKSNNSDNGWLRTLAALALVVAIIFAVRWTLRRLGGAKTAHPAAGVVEVLSRTSVSPRQQVLLVRFGKRLLLVGSGPQGLRTLAEAASPEESAELLEAARASKADVFAGIFRRKAEAFKDAGKGSAIGGVADKIRSHLSQKEGEK
jgi:flagellar biosynthetic protein FliO